jgi:hypothetical protein
MREREMRQRVERFLQTRLRRMLAPATIGFGLAVAPGCPSSGLQSGDDAAAVAKKDAAPDQQEPMPLYMVQFPPDSSAPGNADLGADQVTTKYIAPVPPDAAPDQKVVVADVAPVGQDTGVPGNRDAGRDLQAVPLYMVQFPPDAGADQIASKYMASVPDAAAEVPMPQPDYIAPVPKLDAGPALRYMAQMPDAAPEIGGAVAVYLAQLPPQA